jgi:hypothetical protein
MEIHTAGPWEVTEKPGVWVGPVVRTKDNKGIAFVVGQSLPNARLIAAAPELLAACRLAEDALDFAQAQVESESDRAQLLGWLYTVRQAIAAAR